MFSHLNILLLMDLRSMYSKTFYVYILTNVLRSVLYTGITNELRKRIIQHYLKTNEKSFTAKYNVYNLLYFEEHGYVINAIEREKEIKNMTRRKNGIDQFIQSNAKIFE
ncbi:MAG TPA: GIY-YIG nuclease family protein [Flavisolibacter sp.]